MTVAEAQSRISPREYVGWVAYNRVEPPIEQVCEYMLARLLYAWVGDHTTMQRCMLPPWPPDSEVLTAEEAQERLTEQMRAAGFKADE
jgi:hypothetical protein